MKSYTIALRGNLGLVLTDLVTCAGNDDFGMVPLLPPNLFPNFSLNVASRRSGHTRELSSVCQ